MIRSVFIYGEPINVLHRQELHRFDESTKQEMENTFSPLGFMSQEEHTRPWPRLGFLISDAKENVN